MGWFGYSIYSGDETQTQHYDFIKWAGVKAKEDQVSEWLGIKGTKIPKKFLPSFIKGIPRILKKMPKKIIAGNGRYDAFDSECNALEWQMLLALFLDNKIQPPKVVYDKGIEGTEYLMTDHASDFDYPGMRRQSLRRFIKRVKKLGHSFLTIRYKDENNFQES